VDFEPVSIIDPNDLTLMILEWGRVLHYNNLTLWLWIGYGGPYDMRLLMTSPYIKFMTMNTYVNSYTDFINVASHMQNQYTIEKLGYGLLTYPNGMPITENDMAMISDWLNLTKSHMINLWASNIPPIWYRGLQRFLIN